MKIISLIKFLCSLIPISIYLYYVSLTNTNHYKNWLGWSKTQKSSFKKILVLFKVVRPPSFDWYCMDEELTSLKNDVKLIDKK